MLVGHLKKLSTINVAQAATEMRTQFNQFVQFEIIISERLESIGYR